jgi:hypothetical protein
MPIEIIIVIAVGAAVAIFTPSTGTWWPKRKKKDDSQE